MIDSDAFSIICSFLIEREILSFSMTNKHFFHYYKNNLHPEIKNLFLRSRKFDSREYLVATTFADYLGYDEPELFYHACVCGNHILVEELIKKNVLEKKNAVNNFCEEHNSLTVPKNIMANDGIALALTFSYFDLFKTFAKYYQIEIVAIFYLIRLNYIIDYSQLVDILVDITPENYDFSKISKLFNSKEFTTNLSFLLVINRYLTSKKITKLFDHCLTKVVIKTCTNCVLMNHIINLATASTNEVITNNDDTKHFVNDNSINTIGGKRWIENKLLFTYLFSDDRSNIAAHLDDEKKVVYKIKKKIALQKNVVTNVMT